MASADYLSVVGACASRPAFEGVVPATPWDPELQRALEKERTAIYEEDVRERLLGCMASS